MSNAQGIELGSVSNQNSSFISPTNYPISEFQSSQQGVYDHLNKLFNEQNSQAKTIQEARDILGESASSLTDGQVFDLVNEIQYLVDTWLEEYEQKVFGGKKLKELLQINL